MNIPYLYDACFGMYMQKMKEFNRDKDKDIAKVSASKTYKHAMSSFRILDFLERFQKSSFGSFKQAIQYDAQDPIRGIEVLYKSVEVNVSLKEKFEQLIKERVKAALIESLNRD